MTDKTRDALELLRSEISCTDGTPWQMRTLVLLLVEILLADGRNSAA